MASTHNAAALGLYIDLMQATRHAYEAASLLSITVEQDDEYDHGPGLSCYESVLDAAINADDAVVIAFVEAMRVVLTGDALISSALDDLERWVSEGSPDVEKDFEALSAMVETMMREGNLNPTMGQVAARMNAG